MVAFDVVELRIRETLPHVVQEIHSDLDFVGKAQCSLVIGVAGDAMEVHDVSQEDYNVWVALLGGLNSLCERTYVVVGSVDVGKDGDGLAATNLDVTALLL